MGKHLVREQLALTAEDLHLHILDCSKEPLPGLQNTQVVDPKQLPNLPFSDYSFDLALCTQVLFSENSDLTKEFHIAAILELLRIAGEVRLFPIIHKDGTPSVYLGPVVQALQELGLEVELRQVELPLKQGSHALLRIWQQSCALKNSAV